MAWSSVGNIKGPTGPSGSDGAQGPQGLPGSTYYEGLVTSAQTTTSTVATNLTGLTISNVPAGTYILNAYVIYRVNVAGNPSFGITGPTLGSMSLMRTRQLTATTFTSGTLVTTYGVSALSGTTTANLDMFATLQGRLTTNASGNVIVQFASPIATTTVTVQPGSYVTLL